MTGKLTIVGTGIMVVGQTTLQARAHMEQADKLLFLVADPASTHWITKLNASAESLQSFYAEDKPRQQTYLEMVDRILACVREGGNVCVAFYGHPGVFVFPSHEAIRRARLEGFEAHMLPGISAEDCLFADLGIDPAEGGCQTFEATDFLVYKRTFDARVPLILWQIGAVGELGYRPDRLFNRNGLETLVNHLAGVYGSDHEVVVYQAAQYPVCDPVINVVALGDLCDAGVTPISTLYVPPGAPSSLDISMLSQLGIPLPEHKLVPAID